MKAKQIGALLFAAEHAVHELREALEEFCDERGIDTVDVENIPAADLFKHAKLVVLASGEPKRKAS